jgi:excisionase family DNA binding protein
MSERIAYTIREAAEAVGLSETVVRRAYRSGQLPVHFITSNPTILRVDLEEWVAAAPTQRRQSA